MFISTIGRLKGSFLLISVNSEGVAPLNVVCVLSPFGKVGLKLLVYVKRDNTEEKTTNGLIQQQQQQQQQIQRKFQKRRAGGW